MIRHLRLPASALVRGRHDPRWAYVLVIAATLLWAGNMTLGRALRDQVGPFTLTAARVAIASLVFLLMFRGLPPGERRLGAAWPSLAAMSLLGVVACPVTAYLALHYTTAANASLITGTGPLVTALLAAWLLRTRLSAGQLAGAVLSLLGVGLVVGAGRHLVLSGFALNRGDLIMLVNVPLWGLYSVISQVATRSRPAVWASAFSTWFALPLLLPVAIAEWRQAPPVLNGPVLLAVLYIGSATCLGYLAWNEGIRRVGSAGVMAFYNMLPVFGVLLGALFLAERLAPVQFLGGALIIAGGLAAAVRSRGPALPGGPMS